MGKLTKAQLEQYEKDGYLVIENLVSPSQCDRMRKEIDSIIEKELGDKDLSEIPKFPYLKAINDSSKEDLDYFMESGDKVRCFFDKTKRQTVGGKGQAKGGCAETAAKNAKNAKPHLNKIGHALHALNPVFKEITRSNEIQNVYCSLGAKQPIVCQSMYVLKQNFTDSKAPGHQDATYIHVEPDTLTGLWIATEDCTAANGCLKIVPGSHKQGLRRKFIRNPNKEECAAGRGLIYSGLVYNYDDEQFVSVPIKKGSAILLNGLVMHKSTHTASPQSREVYVIHAYDGKESTYQDDNWMRYSPVTFDPLY